MPKESCVLLMNLRQTPPSHARNAHPAIKGKGPIERQVPPASLPNVPHVQDSWQTAQSSTSRDLVLPAGARSFPDFPFRFYLKLYNTEEFC